MSQWIRRCATVFVGLTLALAFDALADGESPKMSADDAVAPGQAAAPKAPHETTREPEAKAAYTIADATKIPDAPVYRPPKRGKPRLTVGETQSSRVARSATTSPSRSAPKPSEFAKEQCSMVRTPVRAACAMPAVP